MAKKRTKRSRSKHPGLDPKLNKGSVRDFLDFDYTDKLTDAEKEWLSKFSTEYYSASFDHSDTKYKNKQPLIKSKKARRKIYRDNNHRNIDTTSYLGNFKKLLSFEDLADYELKTNNQEDLQIELLDVKKKSKS